MKFLNFLMVITAVLVLGLACTNSSDTQEGTQQDKMEMQEGDHSGHDHMNAESEQDKSGPEYTSKYICPMHCSGSGSAEAGKCPVCNMDYVLNEDH